MAHGRIIKICNKKQAGVVLFVFLLLLISSAACLLISKTDTNLLLVIQEYRTETALKQARDALIGYAVSYPDKINSDYGPGYLPCPDRNDDGATDPGGCSMSGRTSIGRFPYKTLELEQLRDAQGENLWYVIADNFRNNPKREPLNSDTMGNLFVDGMGDIAAVIFAPGQPLPLQDRITSFNDVSNYLEDENADYDTEFVSHSAGNDRLAYITRQALMQVVERRVLAEISRGLNQYHNTYHAFPWLSPFLNPADSTFHSHLDSSVTPKKGWQGHIAFHPFYWATNPSRMSGSNPFSSDVHWSWKNIQNGIISSNGTVEPSCVMNLHCATGPFQNISSLESTTPVQCIWTDRETVDCGSASIISSVSYTYPPAVGCENGMLQRTYTMNIPQFSGTVTVHEPTMTTYRSREVVLNGSIPIKNEAVQIEDVYHGPLTASCNHGSVITGSGSMTFTAETTGILSTSNIHYDLDVGSGEMPEWIFKNDWHKLVYIAYAEADMLPGSASGVCIAENNCLILDGAARPFDRNHAMALIAGRALEGQSRPSAQLSAYFESANSIPDEKFEQGKITETFNDQVIVISVP